MQLLALSPSIPSLYLLFPIIPSPLSPCIPSPHVSLYPFPLIIKQSYNNKKKKLCSKSSECGER